MKFVIMSRCAIPGYGVRGPVLTPRSYDLHQVLKWLSCGIDVREVMEDGSYRKLQFNDEKINDEISKEIAEKRLAKSKQKKVEKRIVKPKKKALTILPEEEIKEIKIKKEVKIDKPKVEEVKAEEPNVELPIDELEKPE